MGQSASSSGFGSGSSGGFGSDYREGFRSGYSGGFGSDNTFFGTGDNFAFNFGGAGTGPNFFSGSSSYGPRREFGFDTNRFSPGVELINRCRRSAFSSGLGETETFSDHPAWRDQEPSLCDVAKTAANTKSSAMPLYPEVVRFPQPMRFGCDLVDQRWIVDPDKDTFIFGATAILQCSKPGFSLGLNQPLELDLFNDVRLGDTQLWASTDRQSAYICLNPNAGGKKGSIFVSDTFLASKINEWLPTDALKNVKLGTTVSWTYSPPIRSEFVMEGLVGHQTFEALDLAITVGVAKKWTSESETSVHFIHNRSTKWWECDTPLAESSGKGRKSKRAISCKHKQQINQYLDIEAGMTKTIDRTSSDGTQWSIAVKPRFKKV